MTNSERRLTLWFETYYDHLSHYSKEFQNDPFTVMASVHVANASVRHLEDLAVVENGRLFEDD